MKKIIPLFLSGLLLTTTLIAQTITVNYGSNAAAGRYVELRGIKMYVEIYGKGKPLLLIHGNGGSISDFKSTIPYFSAKYRVIAADSRAQGRTQDAGDSLSFEMMADDFAALLDHLKIDSAYVIGWSDGGINTLLLAQRHRGKVIKLVSTGANLTPDSSAIRPADWLAEKEQYERDKNKTWSTAKEKNDWKLFMLDWLQPNVPFTALRRIKCPSLIICGDNDVITTAHTIRIYSYIPKANLWIVPHSGHATLQEHKDEFNQTVNRFFKEPFQQSDE